MKKTGCPYPSKILDGEECNQYRIIWNEGYKARSQEVETALESIKETAQTLDADLQNSRKAKAV